MNRAPALPDPRQNKQDNWAKKIDIARQAREAGKAARGDRPVAIGQPKLSTT